MLPLHIEIVQRKHSSATKDHVKELVQTHLYNFSTLSPRTVFTESDFGENPELKEHVRTITFCDTDHVDDVPSSGTELTFHVYKLDSFGPETDSMTDASSGEEVSAVDVWTLPNEEFHGLWESLVYETKLKQETLRFVETAFEFSDRGVDPNIIAWNRVVLLHGPPGTGKTSLCRALAQKLAIRLSGRFSRARLLEINAHGLFSKWFSESGKLVARLFERVREVLEDRRLLACVLIDEVESLAHARRSALAGLEPSDSIRAVNAILTQLDRLRRHPNALVLTTSNVTGAIDVAFVDRADIKRLVGPPGPRAAYEILRGCCGELVARGLVGRAPLFALRVLEAAGFAESESSQASLRLWRVARRAAAGGVSARALRRLPFLALALHAAPAPPAPALADFLTALAAAAARQEFDAADLDEKPCSRCAHQNGILDEAQNGTP